MKSRIIQPHLSLDSQCLRADKHGINRNHERQDEVDQTRGRRHPLGGPLSPADLGLTLTASAYDGLGTRYRRYPKWAWCLTLLGVPGGVLGYFVIRDLNASAARSILKGGLAVQVLACAVWLAYGGM
jgi:hypothetical protein